MRSLQVVISIKKKIKLSSGEEGQEGFLEGAAFLEGKSHSALQLRASGQHPALRQTQAWQVHRIVRGPVCLERDGRGRELEGTKSGRWAEPWKAWPCASLSTHKKCEHEVRDKLGAAGSPWGHPRGEDLCHWYSSMAAP